GLPTPRRDLWDKNSYRCIWTQEKMQPWTPLYPAVSMVRASWGCRMKCTFCVVPQLSNSTHMASPVERTADEIASAPSDHIYFCDDENFIDEKFAHDLADALERRGVKKRYFAWSRAATVNRSPELFVRWRELGLDTVFIGFEFIDTKELKAVKKGGSAASNERALKALRSLDIAVHAAFMVQPHYDEGHFERLRHYIRALPPAQCSFTVCTPSPGSKDYERIQDQIWVDNANDLHDCMHAITPTRLPLKRFNQLFARQVAEGVAKTPLRQNRHPLHLGDIVKVVGASLYYQYAFRTLGWNYRLRRPPEKFQVSSGLTAPVAGD
ncbi:MAG: B12-binding domain-containing radical SAM protein, partial [Candidatus Competibacterales bacterium]